MNKNVQRVAIAAVAAVWGVVAFACSGDDENPATARPDSGLGTGDGTTSPTSTSTGTMPGAAICGNYGGAAGVANIASSIMTAVGNDCRISGGFAGLSPTDSTHLSQCFTIQLQSFFQCPGITYGDGTKDANGQQCRNMTDAHRNLNLRKADFDAFRTIALAQLQAANLTDQDQISINAAILGTETGVVQDNTQPDKDTYCTCPNGLYNDASCLPYYDASDGSDASKTTDSGTDAGSTTDSSFDAGG